MTDFNLSAAVLSARQFNAISVTVFRQCGIKLSSGKEELVKSRLMNRLRTLGLSSFDEYIGIIESDATGSELTTMIDCLTTNKTSFFREAQHFDFLRDRVLPAISDRTIRIWSAGCSSGEEPYTLAMVLHESVPDIDRWNARILATDISTRVLARAREGIYGDEDLADLPAGRVSKWFTSVAGGGRRQYKVKQETRKLVTFARLNLMGDWPMSGPFDVIFCRNVMIYFGKEIQQRLVERFRRMLSPGGYLFVGHSESMTGLAHDFRYIQPAVYQRT